MDLQLMNPNLKDEVSRPPEGPSLPNAFFRLKMVRADGSPAGDTRWAIFNPYQAQLTWEDNTQPLIDGSPQSESHFRFTPVSAQNPSAKNHHLKLVKIQVGFGCNYSCGYCSQQAFRPSQTQITEQEISNLIAAFTRQYDGGLDGLGEETRIDFIGGETLLYWKTVKKLAVELKRLYPKIRFSLYTNGSIIIDDLAEAAIDLGLLVMLSHDGLDQIQNRGKDPFHNPNTKNYLTKLAGALIPHNLFLVQMTLGKSNFTLVENRELLCRELSQSAHQLPIAYDIVHSFEKNSKSMIPNDQLEIAKFQERVLREFRRLSWAQMLGFAGFRMDLSGFLDPLVGRSKMAECHQRCEMDKPTSIAFDMKGNVLTCQNTTTRGGHKIGHLNEFSDIRLNTATHWSLRKNCQACPVVSMCRGACMYTSDRDFQKTCDSMFSYYLSVLAYAIENIVGWRLIEIHGDNVRSRGVNTIFIK